MSNQNASFDPKDAGLNSPAGDSDSLRPLSPNQRAWRRFKRNRPAVLSVWLLAVVVVFVLACPLLSPYRPEQLSEAQFQPPNGQHWLGTDVHGRDLLVRLCYGAQISLLVGMVGASVCLVIGVSWGSIAGYVGGRLDGGMMRVVDILYSLPSIIFAIVLISAVEPPLINWLAALGIGNAGKSARLLVLFVALGAVSWLTDRKSVV